MLLRTAAHWELLPSGRSILMWLNNDHFHCHRRAQEVDHLLVGQSCHSHFTDLDQAAPLPQACFPCKSKGLHVCHYPFKVHVESELAQSISPQGHFRGFASSGHYLRKHRIVTPLSGHTNIIKICMAWYCLSLIY